MSALADISGRKANGRWSGFQFLLSGVFVMIKKSVTIGLMSNGDCLPVLLTSNRYTAALRRAGAQVVPLPWRADMAGVWAARFDGFLLPGGGDADPKYFGQTPIPGAHQPNPVRDEAELSLIYAARAARKPLLGICRGAQMLNIALGGGLVQDIPSLRPEGIPEHHSDPEHRFRPDHPAIILPGTTLHRILGVDRLLTNSCHHQACDHPAPGLRVSALSPAGLVEAVESLDGPFLLGIQWHPEVTAASDPLQQAIFDAFVAAARCG